MEKKEDLQEKTSEIIWESNQTVGEILKMTRESKGLTLSHVADQTHLKKTFVDFLEQDRYDELPGKIHTNGFIRIYAHFLGLNSEKLLLKLRKQEMLDKQTPLNEITKISKELNQKGVNKKILIVIGVIILVFLLFYMIFSRSSNSQTAVVKQEKGSFLQNDEVVLNASNVTHTFNLEKNSSFVFTIDNQTFHYKVIDFNQETIILKYADNKENIYLLMKELLKHDYKNNYVYGYEIIPNAVKSKTVELTVKLIKDLRTENQAAISTFLNNNNLVEGIGTVELRSRVSYPVSFFMINADSSEKEMIVEPYGKMTLPLFADNQLLVHTLYFSDLSALYLNINGEMLNNDYHKGSLGLIQLTLPDPSNKKSLKYQLIS